MNAAPAKARDPYWDIVRGIAILLVILGHSIHTAMGVEAFGSRLIYSFHLPLFMFISGWFFSGTLRHPAHRIVVQKFLMLVMPCIVCGTIDYLADHPEGISTQLHLIKWYGRVITSLWFLLALFICSMIVLLGERLFKQHSIWFYLFVFALFFVTPDFMKQAGAKYLFPSFLFGFYLKRYNGIEWFRRHKWPVLASCLVVFLLLFGIYTYEKGSFYHLRFYLFSGIDRPSVILFWNIYRILIGLAGCILIMAGIRFLYEKCRSLFLWKVISRIGIHSYGMYIASVYLWLIYLNKLQPLIPIRHNYGYVMALFAAKVLISYPLGILIEKGIQACLPKK